MPGLVAEVGQVEQNGGGIAVCGDGSVIEGDPAATGIQHRVGTEGNAVGIGLPAHDGVFEVQIARAGAGIIHRRARHPADIEHQVGRACHRHGLAEVDPHLDGLAHGIAQGGVGRGRGD